MAKKVKIGLLGAGRIGKLHGTNVQNFIPEAEISVVADPFMNDSMKEWAESVGIKKTSSNPEDVFADPEVDAVFICSSTDTHADFIIQAAKAGKPYFLRETHPHRHRQDQRSSAGGGGSRREAAGRLCPQI